MNEKQFKELQVGDKVIVTGNGGLGIKHLFSKGEIIIDKIYDDGNFVYAHDDKEFGQWVSIEDIELEGEEQCVCGI